MSQELGRKAVSDFIKAFSCSYSVTRNLGREMGIDERELPLSAVVGFGSGVSTVGDICGVVSGGVTVLGCRFPGLPDPEFYRLCAEYYRRLQERVGVPDCGSVHGGRHLASDFRRAILTGKTRQCSAMVRHGSVILADLAEQVDRGETVCADEGQWAVVQRAVGHLDEESFHCCRSTLAAIAGRSGLNVDPLLPAARGFCGGIGFNGTLCGAIVGGVLCLGLRAGVDLSRSGYRDTMRLVLSGLVKSGGVFRDERRFPAARLFGQCRKVYETVEAEYGAAHCRGILGVRLDREAGVDRYMTENRMERCRSIVGTVAGTVHQIWTDN